MLVEDVFRICQTSVRVLRNIITRATHSIARSLLRQPGWLGGLSYAGMVSERLNLP